MQVIRTPEHRFQNLPDYNFKPHFMEINGLKIHYLDEGKGSVLLCLHGEPTWSYMYRHVVKHFSARYRVIVPDFIGFGKSDKPVNRSDYSFRLHFETLKEFISRLGLTNINMIVHDWGGLLGLSVLGAHPGWFNHLVIMNTFLPAGKPLSLPFRIWKLFARWHPNLPVKTILRIGTYQRPEQKVLKAYQAPFPDRTYKQGAKAFPLLIPGHSGMEGVAQLKQARKVLAGWEKPTLVLFSEKDPIMGDLDRFFKKNIPGARKVQDVQVKNAGHFLLEDAPQMINHYIEDYLQQNILFT